MSLVGTVRASFVRKRRSKTDKAKEAFWRKTLARHLESGLGPKAFCESEELNINNFSWWRKEISYRDAMLQLKNPVIENPPMFVPIVPASNVKARSDESRLVAEIDLSAGTVRIFAGIDRHSLQEIMTAVREVAL